MVVDDYYLKAHDLTPEFLWEVLMCFQLLTQRVIGAIAITLCPSSAINNKYFANLLRNHWAT